MDPLEHTFRTKVGTTGMSQISWPSPPTITADVEQLLDDFNQAAKTQPLNEAEEEYGFTYVGHGQRRNVYTHPDLPSGYVVKLAKGDGGARENKEEHTLRERVPDGVRDRFVPLDPVASDYSWGIAPRVNDAGGVTSELEQLFDEYGVYIGGELFVENVGEYQKKTVILDYGNSLSFL